MKCEYCDTDFESKRSTARYCSAKCRKLAFRALKDMQDGNAKVDANLVDKHLDLTTDPAQIKPQRCTDPETLEIWDRHKAQQRPTVYPDPVGKGIYV